MAKILIVDDSKKHRNAAHVQLEAQGHEVVTVSDYADVFRKAGREAFDVALLDLMMPAESMTLGTKGMEFIGQEIMVGYPLSMFLAKSGVRHIAVVTDTNHHDHPAVAIMDFLCHQSFNINGASVMYLNARLTEDGGKNWAEALAQLMR